MEFQVAIKVLAQTQLERLSQDLKSLSVGTGLREARAHPLAKACTGLAPRVTY